MTGMSLPEHTTRSRPAATAAPSTPRSASAARGSSSDSSAAVMSLMVAPRLATSSTWGRDDRGNKRT